MIAMWREASAGTSETLVTNGRDGRKRFRADPPMIVAESPMGEVIEARRFGASEIAGGGFETAAPMRFSAYDAAPRFRRGLASSISFEGIGLHSAETVRVTLAPAESGQGIVFCRTDLPECRVPARYDNVVDTRLCTALADAGRPEQRIGTVEHLMAALAGLAIDDAEIRLDGPEMPILDGSADAFVFLIHCAGIVESSMPRRMIQVMRPVRVTDGAAEATLLPVLNGEPGLSLDLEIEFAAAAIGRQHYALDLSASAFEQEIARARTFTFVSEIEALHAAGLARGGSLANAIVVDGADVVNPEGLRFPDEFVRHKLLDVVGDLALAGAPLIGRVEATRSGHRINNRLLHALFADPANYRIVPAAAAMVQPEAA